MATKLLLVEDNSTIQQIVEAAFIHDTFDVVTARALAPLRKLLDLAYPLLKAGTVGIFPKGQDVESELTEATKYWSLSSKLVPSRTEAAARLAVVSEVTKR